MAITHTLVLEAHVSLTTVCELAKPFLRWPNDEQPWAEGTNLQALLSPAGRHPDGAPSHYDEALGTDAGTLLVFRLDKFELGPAELETTAITARLLQAIPDGAALLRLGEHLTMLRRDGVVEFDGQHPHWAPGSDHLAIFKRLYAGDTRYEDSWPRKLF